MPLTDDEFYKNGKLETYLDIMDQLKEQEDDIVVQDYQLNIDDDEEEE